MTNGLLIHLALAAHAAPIVDPFTEPDESELYARVEQTVTVASRTSQKVEEAPAIVTVLTHADLRARGHRTLADVLRALPGVYVTVSDESRSVAWFRGVTSPDNNKVLLLIDGEPWYDGVYGHAWIDGYLPLDNVRQVEIIKGPGSAIHGTNAFAGVINVVTYAPGERGSFVRVATGNPFSTYGTARIDVPVSMLGAHGGVSAWAHAGRTDGDGLDTTPRGRRNVTGIDPEQGVATGARLHVGGLDVRYDLFNWRHTYFVNEQDDALDVLVQNIDNFSLDYLDQGARAAWELDLGRVTLTPRVAWRSFDDPGHYAWFNDPVTTTAEDGTLSTAWSTTLVETFKVTRRTTVAVDAEARLGTANTLVGGLGGALLQVDRIEDVTYEDRGREPVQGITYRAPETTIPEGWLYAQDTWQPLTWLGVTAGTRVDVHGLYGAFPSPRAGLVLEPSPDTVVKILYGRAFRAPNARELLVEVSADENGDNLFTSGNPGLSPERIQTFETEASATLGPAKLRAAGFYSQVRDTIDRRAVDTPVEALGDLYYDNLGGSDILGAEVQSIVGFGSIEVDGSWSWTKGTDLETSFRVYEFPEHMAHLRVGWHQEDVLALNVSVDAAGARPRAEWSPDAGAGDGPGYALVNLGARTTPDKERRVAIDLSVTNAFDSPWTTLVYRDDANATNSDGSRKYTNDLEGPGRIVRVGLEYAF